MENINSKQYFEYLKGRSNLSKYYRWYFLYPKLIRYLSGRVLDVGCGIGDFLSQYKNSVGVDINPYTISYCRQMGFEALLVKNKFPFPSESFNGAILDNVIEHLTDPTGLLMETRRVLKDKGRLIIGVPGKLGYVADPTHSVFYDSQKLKKTLSDSGFRLIKKRYSPLRSDWLDRNMRQYCLYGIFEKS
jgi:SAM-dependent methyltransferase